MKDKDRAVIFPATWEIKETLQKKKMRNDFHTYVNRMPQGIYLRQDQH
jgi:hypothetical protein